MSNIYRGLSKDDSYQVSIHLPKRLQRRRFFRNQPIRNKNCLWWPCLINRSGRNKQSLERTCHRCFLLSFGSFVQVVSEKIFFYRPIRNMFFNSSEQIVNKWAIVIEDLPRMLPTKFRFIWQSSFRGKDFLEINQSETRIVCGGHVC